MNYKNWFKLRTWDTLGILLVSGTVVAQTQTANPASRDTIPAGVQGSINPLMENKVIITGDESYNFV